MSQPDRLKASDIVVGARAGLFWAASRRTVQILADLGEIGGEGRRLVRVRVVSPAETMPLEFDIPAELLIRLDDNLAVPRAKPRRPSGPRLPA